MTDRQTRERIIALIHKEVVPAIGCTEPMAVALCTARAKEKLGEIPENIDVLLSPNILKNAMGVGIPGTGMVGLPIAVALGALIGKSEYQLEVLKDLTPETLEEGKRYVEQKRIRIGLKEGIREKLYVEVSCQAQGKAATAVIAGGHTRFVEPGAALDASADPADDDIQLNLRLVWDFATTAPLPEIAFMDETRQYNMEAARQAIKGNYGHNLGKTIDRPLAKGILGDTIYSHIISRTAAACDAGWAAP